MEKLSNSAFSFIAAAFGNHKFEIAQKLNH